jgi:hypothetical protein
MNILFHGEGSGSAKHQETSSPKQAWVAVLQLSSTTRDVTCTLHLAAASLAILVISAAAAALALIKLT